MKKVKKVRKWILVLTPVALAIPAVAWFGRNAILRVVAEHLVREKFGMEITIDAVQWHPFARTLQLKNISVRNPPEYGASRLLFAPNLTLEFNAANSDDASWHIRNCSVDLAEIRIIRNQQGKVNLEAVDTAVRALSTAESRHRSNRIDKLYLSLDRVSYTDLQETQKSREFQLHLRNELVENIQTSNDAGEWLGGLLFRIVVQEIAKGTGRRIELTIDGVRQK